MKSKSITPINLLGLHNAAICSVNDVGYTFFPSNEASEFPPNTFNKTQLRALEANNQSAAEQYRESKYLTKRKEKVVPPNGIWRTYGLSNEFE